MLSGKAVERVQNSDQKLITTDSILPSDEVKASAHFEQLTIAPLLGEAILRIAEDRSISALFK